MVKKISSIILLLILTLLVYCMIYGTLLKSVNCKLHSSNSIEIPVKMYLRNDGEYVLLFDKGLNLGIYTVLVVDVNHKIIGLPEGGSKSFVKLPNNYLYQKQKGNQFTAIHPSNHYFDDSEIFDVEFVNQNEIKFKSSLAGLKTYGEDFVLKW